MIWIIGGTSESFEIVEYLKKRNCEDQYVISVTTEHSKTLIEKLNCNIKIVAKPMKLEEIFQFVKSMNIVEVIDLSHPYAKEITANAILVCKELKLPYLRYERDSFYNEYCHLGRNVNDYISFKTVKEIAKYIECIEGNILITLGGNSIDQFIKNINLENLYFRVIPDYKVIKKAVENGISQKRIIAMYGPFSKEMNKATIAQYNISCLVTKSSGTNGGEREKIQAAIESRCKLIFLTPPDNSVYGEIIFSLKELKDRLN